jgi:Electron transfer DM13
MVTSIVGTLAVGLTVFVLLWFEPQKYFLDRTVTEAAPVGEQSTVVASGEFRSLEHGTSGTALLIRSVDGSLVLRLEDLDTTNGPDLRLYLSQVPAGDDARAYGERFVDLGGLKGNKGDQNYKVPRGVDTSSIHSVVIWCRRFTVGFGVAPLEA